jgi:hypothetical protein
MTCRVKLVTRVLRDQMSGGVALALTGALMLVGCWGAHCVGQNPTGGLPDNSPAPSVASPQRSQPRFTDPHYAAA